MNKCICGNIEFKEVEKACYDVSSKGETKQIKDGIVKFGQCSKCGLIRQLNLPFNTVREYVDYYAKNYPPIKESYKAKTWEHDKLVARLRCDEYKMKRGDAVFDVGCGSGAFVDECRQRGQFAYGCDIANYSYAESNRFVSQFLFEDIYFSGHSFDWVTCHDVLEHLLTPVQLLEKMFRILRGGGTCIVDIPRFFHKSGKHHWKKEHIWYFNENQLKELLAGVGFIVTDIKYPIESKVVFYCSKLI